MGKLLCILILLMSACRRSAYWRLAFLLVPSHWQSPDAIQLIVPDFNSFD
jgi:hypothetical protein